MPNAEKMTLSVYFGAVERRLLSVIPRFYDVNVQIGERMLCFHFQTHEQEMYAKKLLTGLCVDVDHTAPNAEFFFWTDEMADFLPPNCRGNGVWFSKDETGYLHITSSQGLWGADYTRNRYYSCIMNWAERTKITGFNPLLVPLFRWAYNEDMMLMHAAVVGVGGRGVLLGARGGAGKSTLAAACLMNGMDFVADDYVLLSRQGSLCAMPLFRTIGLSSDMEELLQTGLPILKGERARNEKLLLDASGRQFCDSLRIEALIFPSISSDGESRIEPIPPGKMLAQMVYSSLTQFEVSRDVSIVREMLERLRGLFVYEMHLSRDPWENARCLEDFIKGLASNR